MTSKTYFGCIDFRNAKYMGSISGGECDGVGITLDHMYRFSLTNWKNNHPYGPTLIVFPTRDYLYGHIKNQQLNGICAYVKFEAETYFFNFVDGISEAAVLIDNNKYLVEGLNFEGSLRVTRTHQFTDQRQKWTIISNILKVEVSSAYQSYFNFVSHFLVQKFPDLVELSSTSNHNFIGIKNEASLGVKLGKNNTLKQIGYFSNFPRQIEFGLQFTDAKNQTKIEEGIFTEPPNLITYFIKSERPPSAVKLTEDYFKSGTGFKNVFMRFPTFDNIYSLVQRLSKGLKNQTILEFGQRIIENNYERVDYQRDDYQATKQYTIQEMKEQVYRAVQRRNNGIKRSVGREKIGSNERLPNSNTKQDNLYTLNSQKQSQYHYQPKDNSQSPKRRRYDYSYKEDMRDTLSGRQRQKINEFTLNLIPVPMEDIKHPQVPYFDQKMRAYPEQRRPRQKSYQKYAERVRLRQGNKQNQKQGSPEIDTFNDLYYHLKNKNVEFRNSTTPNKASKYKHAFSNFKDVQQQSENINAEEYNNYIKYKNRNKDKNNDFGRSYTPNHVPDKTQRINNTGTEFKKYQIYRHRINDLEKPLNEPYLPKSADKTKHPTPTKTVEPTFGENTARKKEEIRSISPAPYYKKKFKYL